MFTGIVEAVGEVREVRPHGDQARVLIGAGHLDLSDVRVGDSIAVDGCCLTVVALDADAFRADVSRATLDHIAGFSSGAAVNLEKALRLSDRLGGHLVTGHVDGRGVVVRFEPAGASRLLVVRVPADLVPYVARKGSITLSGVSLTVNRMSADELEVNLIPHTLHATNLEALYPGAQLNVEVDLVARYIQQLLATSR